MDEYIKREVVLAVIADVMQDCKISHKHRALNRNIKQIAAADPVPRSKWISNYQTGEYICSLCGALAPVDCLKEDFYESNFCPNCGAKMKGGAE